MLLDSWRQFACLPLLITGKLLPDLSLMRLSHDFTLSEAAYRGRERGGGAHSSGSDCCECIGLERYHEAEIKRVVHVTRIEVRRVLTLLLYVPRLPLDANCSCTPCSYDPHVRQDQRLGHVCALLSAGAGLQRPSPVIKTFASSDSGYKAADRQLRGGRGAEDFCSSFNK